MMLPKEYHPKVLAWTMKHVARDVKRRELRNALLITVTGDREKTAMMRLDECDLGGETLCLQAIPARMTCDEVLEWVGEEVLKEYRNLHHTRGLKAGDSDVNYVGEGSGGCNGQHGQLGQALQRARLCRVAPLSRRKGDLPAWLNNYEDQDLRCFGVK